MKTLSAFLLLLLSLNAFAASGPLKFSQGDGATLRFAVTTDGVTAFNLTGASFETKLTDSKGYVFTFANSQHAVTDASHGYYTLTLSTTDTAAMHGGLLAMAVRITQSSVPLTIHSPAIILVEGYP